MLPQPRPGVGIPGSQPRLLPSPVGGNELPEPEVEPYREQLNCFRGLFLNCLLKHVGPEPSFAVSRHTQVLGVVKW